MTCNKLVVLLLFLQSCLYELALIKSVHRFQVYVLIGVLKIQSAHPSCSSPLNPNLQGLLMNLGRQLCNYLHYICQSRLMAVSSVVVTKHLLLSLLTMII